MQDSRSKLVIALGATTTAGLVGVALLGGFTLGRSNPAATTPVQRAGATQLASDTSPATASGATVTVTATGQVYGAPDTVTIDIGVNASGSTASAALDQANTEMSTLQSVFLAQHVAKGNLQTSDLNLDPNYNSSGNITGYSAEEDLTVLMHDIPLAGQLIDTASSAVGNFGHINGITFSISNTSTLLAEARAQAMQNAHTEASQIASGAGVSLGPIKTVTDEEQPQTPTYYPNNFSDAALPAAVPLQAGKQSLSIQVEVVYQLEK